MVGKKEIYTTNLANVDKDNIDLVGIKSIQFKIIDELKLPTSPGFVVTTSAFDDFLVANDLIETITENLENLISDNPKSPKRVSETIQSIILDCEIPNYIKEEIEHSYSNLSGFNENFTNLYLSPLNETLDEHHYSHTSTEVIDIKGKKNIFESIKFLWGQFFSEEAIKYRESIEYSGDLSTAIIINKSVQSDAVGIAFNHDSKDHNKDIIEIEAIYGFEADDVYNDITPDNYKVNKNNIEISEKNIVTQNWMYIRKNNSEGKKEKLNISRNWKQRQKLDDHSIKSLAKIIKTLEDAFETSFRIKWAKEADKILIVDILFRKDINILDIEEQIQQKEREIEIISKKGVSENKDAAAEIEKKKKIPEFSQSHFDIPKKEKPHKKVASGDGNNMGETNGLAKIINDMDDLQDSSQKDILVISENIDLTKKDISSLVFRGIIDESERYKDIELPVISNVFRASSFLREHELIHIDSSNGQISLGAKSKEEENKESENKTIADKSPKNAEKNSTLVVDDFEGIKTSIDIFVDANEKILLPENKENIDGMVSKDYTVAKNIASQDFKKPIVVKLKYDKNPENMKEKINKIRDLRTKDHMRNISIGISNIKTTDQFIKTKKIMHSEKLKRSSTFKIWLIIDNPTIGLNIEEVFESELDGIIIDTTKIITELYDDYNSNLIKSKAVDKILKEIVDKAHKNQTNVYMKLDKINDDLVEFVINKGINGLVVTGNNLKETKEKLSDKEISSLRDLKKR
jgi:pyruvate,water dikinase